MLFSIFLCYVFCMLCIIFFVHSSSIIWNEKIWGTHDVSPFSTKLKLDIFEDFIIICTKCWKFYAKSISYFDGVCIYIWRKFHQVSVLPNELSQAAHFTMWQYEFCLKWKCDIYIKKFRNSHRILDSLCNVAQLPNFFLFFINQSGYATVFLSLSNIHTHIAAIHFP